MPPAEKRSASQPPARTEAGRWSPMTVGTCFGVLSALAYTGANIALKHVAHPADTDWAIWVSCLKAVPVALVAWTIIGYRACRGLKALPPRQSLVPLVLTGLFMQFGGNVMFQWALGQGGLALTVPLMFAALILSGAVLGRIFLNEAITVRSMFAMGALVLSIVFLSASAESASQSLGVDVSGWMGVATVAAACVAGVAYGTSGVVIRRMLTRDMSLSATLVLLSSTGVVGLGLVSLLRKGPQWLIETSSADLWTILAAGVFNAVAFFAVSAAYKRINVVRVNLLNASQAAMAGMAGILIFQEPMTPAIFVGTSLTIAGLMLVEGRRKGLDGVKR